ncbi:MAG TPA: nitroreductase family deazaflavin-dependent oxidoreductase [Acidimicrobiales bacterium]|nr:nitroreductase family deazaflavin-dependent oxidoreductase [Acidimicrobiales bacterium]
MNTTDALMKAVNVIHRAIYNASGGRIAGKGYGMPVLALTTTGRKSGQPRTVMLTSPLRDGDKLIIVASKGGDDRHPEWYLNLKANPKVDVKLGSKTSAMVAHIAEGAERTDLWQRLTADHKNYAQYQTKTDREIPVVVLEPA